MADPIHATFQTSAGDIVVKLLPEKAPKTVENFLGLAEGTREWTDPRSGQKVKTPLYDGTVFHRVIPEFMIQGGDPLGTGTGGPGYKFGDEIGPDNKFDRPGLLAMANAGPNTNGSQFFITEVPTPHLNRGHTIFGEVVKGAVGLDDRQEGLPRHPVHLVDPQDGWLAPPLDLVGDPARGLAHLDLAAGSRRGLHQHEGHVDLPESPEGGLDHALVERTLGPVDAWRVEERELVALPVHDSQDARAGGLGARRDDGHVLPQELVEKRRFPDVGASQDGDESGAERPRQAHYATGPRVMTTFSSFTFALPVRAILAMSSPPFTTSPKMVWPRFRWGVGTSVMKNCEPLVLGPALAIASR